jgi:HTH-type transcriptional regulator / antitoxin HigA
MSQVDLARRTGLSPKHVNQVVLGAASITPEAALLLEKATSVSARLWNRLEASYQDRRLRLEERERLAEDRDWLKQLPVAELVRRGAIEPKSDKLEVLAEVQRFLRVANLATMARPTSSDAPLHGEATVS